HRVGANELRSRDPVAGGAGPSQGPVENVACEACHGPGQAHAQAADKTEGTVRAVPETVCLGCHTRDVTGGDFDYARFAAAVVGPGHGKPPAPAAAQPRVR